MPSIAQLNAAQIVAKGGTDRAAWEAANVSKATFYRWKKIATFQETVAWFQQRYAESSVAEVSTVDIDDSIQRDKRLADKLDSIAHKIADLSVGLLDEIAPEDVSIRVLPSLVRAMTECINCQRQGLDRISGMEQILDELGQIEKASTLAALSAVSSSYSAAA
ncbi:MAG: hypothetical protein AAGI45_11080 [Cyanobacteria bacterium P01_H01_bin.26]